MLIRLRMVLFSYFFDKFDCKDIFFWEIIALKWKINTTRMLKFDDRSGGGL